MKRQVSLSHYVKREGARERGGESEGERQTRQMRSDERGWGVKASVCVCVCGCVCVCECV